MDDDELRAVEEQQKRKLDALDAKFNRLSQEIANREAQNPYESPREHSYAEIPESVASETDGNATILFTFALSGALTLTVVIAVEVFLRLAS